MPVEHTYESIWGDILIITPECLNHSNARFFFNAVAHDLMKAMCDLWSFVDAVETVELLTQRASIFAGDTTGINCFDIVQQKIEHGDAFIPSK